MAETLFLSVITVSNGLASLLHWVGDAQDREVAKQRWYFNFTLQQNLKMKNVK